MSDSGNIIEFYNFDVNTNEDCYIVFSEKSRHFIRFRFKKGKYDQEYIRANIMQAKRQLREENKNDEDSRMGEND